MSYVLESNKLKGNVLRVRRAPEPTDMYRKTLNFTKKYSFIIIFLFFLNFMKILGESLLYSLG